MKPFLSVCMIVKNEDKVLKRCLDSIVDIADEIIIADTGSNDKTKEIATKYTDLVFDYLWENDFSKARNFAASKASGEWILVIDADEFVDRESFIEYKNKLKKSPPAFNILAVQIVNFVGVNGKDTSLNYHERLYKNNGTISYYRSIHELLKHKDSKENRGFAEFQIFHSGYMEQVFKEKDKSRRNLTLLKNKKDKEPIDYFFIGNEYAQIGDLDRAIKYYQKGFVLKDDINRDWVKKLLLRLVNTLQRVNRNKEAMKIIDDCEKIFPSLVDFKFYKGKIYFDKEDYLNAKKIFEEILLKKEELQADSSQDFLEFLPRKILGEIYEHENDLQAAVDNYSKALSINDADDYLWMRLINLLAKHSNLEELAEFLNNNLLKKNNITPQRVIKILLSVPNINVQRVTRSLLEEQGISTLEKEALYIKNLQLDGLNNEIGEILEQKSFNETIALLSQGIFSVIDLLLLFLETKEEKYKKIILDIKFENPIKNLLDMLLKGKNKRLSIFEQELFIQIFKQSYVLQNSNSVDILKRNLKLFRIDEKKNVERELKKYINTN